jgi:hypothetical protein
VHEYYWGEPKELPGAAGFPITKRKGKKGQATISGFFQRRGEYMSICTRRRRGEIKERGFLLGNEEEKLLELELERRNPRFAKGGEVALYEGEYPPITFLSTVLLLSSNTRVYLLALLRAEKKIKRAQMETWCWPTFVLSVHAFTRYITLIPVARGVEYSRELYPFFSRHCLDLAGKKNGL